MNLNMNLLSFTFIYYPFFYLNPDDLIFQKTNHPYPFIKINWLMNYYDQMDLFTNQYLELLQILISKIDDPMSFDLSYLHNKV